jgi:hypothetical protein
VAESLTFIKHASLGSYYYGFLIIYVKIILFIINIQIILKKVHFLQIKVYLFFNKNLKIHLNCINKYSNIKNLKNLQKSLSRDNYTKKKSFF